MVNLNYKLYYDVFEELSFMQIVLSEHTHVFLEYIHKCVCFPYVMPWELLCSDYVLFMCTYGCSYSMSN